MAGLFHVVMVRLPHDDARKLGHLVLIDPNCGSVVCGTNKKAFSFAYLSQINYY